MCDFPDRPRHAHIFEVKQRWYLPCRMLRMADRYGADASGPAPMCCSFCSRAPAEDGKDMTKTSAATPGSPSPVYHLTAMIARRERRQLYR